MSGRLSGYNLAWYKPNVPESGRFLVYVLVPVWMGVFAGTVEFEAINSSGRPLPKVRAAMTDLASPRKRDDTEGIGHPLEVQLIRALGIRAGLASHVLPEVVPSSTFRGWSRLVLTEMQRTLLLRAGGVLA